MSCTVKLSNDPGLCQLTQIALKGFLAQKMKDQNDLFDTAELDQDLEAGHQAANTVCQYVDWLLSTVNPNPPDDGNWIRPEIHLCQRQHSDICDHDTQSDYVDLLNMVRHTRLPLVADKTLYHSKPSSALGGQGHQAHRMFDKVIKLTVNQRELGMTSDQVLFRDLLLRLCKGESTLDDWALLLTRQPSRVGSLSEFDDATSLFYSNEQVAKYNHEQLLKWQNPVADINACHSSAVAKKCRQMKCLD